ncbi:hypothetical protein [Spirosoma koreense]
MATPAGSEFRFMAFSTDKGIGVAVGASLMNIVIRPTSETVGTSVNAVHIPD